MEAQPQSPIKTIGFTEFTTIDGNDYKRRKGTQNWNVITSTPPPIASSTWASSTFALFLVRTNQFENEPLHWALAISPAEDAPSQSLIILEVRGDAGDPYYGMHHSSDFNRPGTLTAMDYVNSVFELSELSADRVEEIKAVAQEETPPKTKHVSRREINENCQGWCVRVVMKLVEKGWVGEEKVEMMEGMLEGSDYLKG